MEPVHSKAYSLPHCIHAKLAIGWKKEEEDELLDGIQFMMKRVSTMNCVSTWKKLTKDVATYLTFTLHDKANV